MKKLILWGGVAAVGVYLLTRRAPGAVGPGGESTLYWDAISGRWRLAHEVGAMAASYLASVPNAPNAQESRVLSYFLTIEKAASIFRVQPALLAAIIAQESGGDPSARGAVGEYGLMQIRSSTAQWMGMTGSPDRLLDPDINIWYGAKYLRWQLDQYASKSNKVYWAVAGYNAGTARRNGEFRNQNYVDGVMQRLTRYVYLFNQIYRRFGEPPSGIWR